MINNVLSPYQINSEVIKEFFGEFEPIAFTELSKIIKESHMPMPVNKINKIHLSHKIDKETVLLVNESNLIR